MSLLQLLIKPANRNLMQVVTKLPQLGVGCRVTRQSWEPYGDSYWEVTKVKPRSEDGAYGKVWGVLTWRGQREPRERQINGRAKKVWRWVPTEAEAARLKLLAQQWQQQERWQAVAAEQQVAEGSGGADSNSGSSSSSSGGAS